MYGNGIFVGSLEQDTLPARLCLHTHSAGKNLHYQITHHALSAHGFPKVLLFKDPSCKAVAFKIQKYSAYMEFFSSEYTH